LEGYEETTEAIEGAGSLARGVPTARVSGPLGAQFLLWETATAVAGRLLGINPFDQPDVEAAKVAARALLDGATGAAPQPTFVEGDVAVHAVGTWLPAGVTTLAEALRALVAATPEHGYLAVQAYLDRIADASAAVLRAELARRSADARLGRGRLQTTFGWGPRFLHSTGQYHKGGHQNGSFLQLTGEVDKDIQVPGTSFTLAELQRAQAWGDAEVLASRGRPVLRLHLLDRPAGLVQVVRAVQEFPP
ncbi:MAG: glucose-6-phosphate isomerase, partial [Pseudonocardiaceae bacterium]